MVIINCKPSSNIASNGLIKHDQNVFAYLNIVIMSIWVGNHLINNGIPFDRTFNHSIGLNEFLEFGFPLSLSLSHSSFEHWEHLKQSFNGNLHYVIFR